MISKTNLLEIENKFNYILVNLFFVFLLMNLIIDPQ